MDYFNYLVITSFLFVVALAITNSSKKDFKYKINRLIDSLGGVSNILTYEMADSRLLVTLRDVSVVDKNSIQKMGAKGIVEMENQLKIILGNDAMQLKKCIKDLK